MTNPLRWNAYMLPDGTVQDEPPVCDVCGNTPLGGIGPLKCKYCHGTGHAPHWRIVPTAGMLVQCNHNDCHDGEWHVTDGAIHNLELHLPLAPPPCAGCTLHDALALLPGASRLESVRGGWKYCVDLSDRFYATIIEASRTPHMQALDSEDYIDPDEAIHAAGKVKELQQYIAGWQQEGK